MDVDVIYEDNHLIVVNKAPGILVQGDITGDTTLADLTKSYLKHRYNKPGAVFLGTVHRIDRPVSGIVVFAKTSKALQRLNASFQKQQVKKVYWAIVHGKITESQQTLIHYLIKNPQKNKSRAYNTPIKNSKICELHYQQQAIIGNYSYIRVYPKTGRPHQIRVQLSHIGFSIKGDVKYGASEPNDDGSICLHAREIAFEHPVRKEPLHITAPPPQGIFWENFIGKIL